MVVGLDGSPSSKAALLWAAHQARLTGGRLHAVTAWEFPACPERAPMIPVGEDLGKAAGAALHAAVHEVLGGGPSGIELVETIVPGHPAQVLIDLSGHGGLLVVGSRGNGVFHGALLGSISHQCVQHARCPVVVVRG